MKSFLEMGFTFTNYCTLCNNVMTITIVGVLSPILPLLFGKMEDFCSCFAHVISLLS